MVAFSVMRAGEEQLIIIAEGSSGDAAQLREKIAQTVNQNSGLQVSHVGIVPVGTIPKTSSGKLQRRKTKQLFEQRQLPEHA